MRRLLIALLFVFASLPVAGVNTVVVMRHAAGGGAFCAGSFDNCDEFTQTADPPTGWTEVTGSSTWATNGTQLRGPTAGSGGMAILYSTVTSSADQYGIIQLAVNDFDTGMLLRSNGVSGFADSIYYWSSGGTPVLGWAEALWNGQAVGDVARCDHTMASGDYLMGLITGTGTTRVVSIWVTSTMPTAPPTTGADCVFTPGTGCTGTNCYCNDTGNTTGCTPTQSTAGTYAGAWTWDAATTRTYDNFAAGSP